MTAPGGGATSQPTESLSQTSESLSQTSETLSQSTIDSPAWELRFRAATVSLPDWAEHAPGRAVAIAPADGVRQVHSLDVATGTLTPLTDRPAGTTDATISPDGAWVWWFDDSDGDECGVWRRQPFGAAPGEGLETPTPLPPAYSSGLLLGTLGGPGGPGGRDRVVVGSSDDDGSRIHVVLDGVAHEVYAHAEDASPAALSHDATLLAVEHSEHGDSRHPALRVLRLKEETRRYGAHGQRIVGADAVAELFDGPGRGLGANAFAPVAGDTRLLVTHEREGSPALLVWDVRTGEETRVDLGLPGDVADADWYPDASALLVAVDHEARTRLYRVELASGAVVPVGPASGTVSGATVRPDGGLWAAWSSAAQPRSIRAFAPQGASADKGADDAATRPEGVVLVTPPGPAAPPSVPVEDVWVDGPGGRIHALLRRPADAPEGEPLPVVVDVHGGPTWHESDSFAPDLAAWVDHGFAVLCVNYRGSTGYGSAWRDALEERVGFTELADVAAVHAALVADGVLDPARSVLSGASWGGYLTLLGLGTQPERWTLGLAGVPVADYVQAYEDEMEGLKAFDRSLFGGSPQEVPDEYRVSSPITYVDQVRAPVLVLAGENDPRCPIRQIDTYLAALAARSAAEPDAPAHAVYRFEAGHGSYSDDERIAQVRAQLAFVAEHLAGAPEALAAG